MPERYEAIRDSLKRRNPKMSLKKAKTSAAKIFNATRKRGEAPVTGRHEGGLRGKARLSSRY